MKYTQIRIACVLGVGKAMLPDLISGKSDQSSAREDFTLAGAVRNLYLKKLI
jgi:hypothetical protein